MFGETIVAILVPCMLFIGMPWIILHYLTRWRNTATLTQEDEVLLDQLYATARRLEDRLATIERIIAADHDDFRPRSAQRAPREDDRNTDRRY